MPINPYANQMATMQAQGIPQGGLQGLPTPQPPVPVPPAATPAPAPNPAAVQNVANAIGRNPRFDTSAFRTARQAWQGQNPMAGAAPGMDRQAMMGALQDWRAQRPRMQQFRQQPNPAAVSGPAAPNGASGI